jgi:hypothetical protein
MADQYYGSKGKIRIVNGTYQPVKDSDMERRLRRGNVRIDMIKKGIPPDFKYQRTSDGKRTFEMHIKCLSKANLLKNGFVVETDDYVKTEKTLRGLGEKNITRQIKNEVCEYSDYEEASKVRKRVIAIQNLKKLDDQEFSFNID